MAKELLGVSKVTSKMHITIPKAVQKALGGVEQGQYILFYTDGKRIWITKGEIKPLERETEKG